MAMTWIGYTVTKKWPWKFKASEVRYVSATVKRLILAKLRAHEVEGNVHSNWLTGLSAGSSAVPGVSQQP
jgi:hypothetical protein